MARCKCTNPCTCYFEYDGDRPNSVYTLPYQNGRYSTRKTGSGTTADPFVIEFIDSEEFQVEAGQVRPSTDKILSSSTSGSSIIGYDIIDYETPNEIFLAFAIQISSGNVYPSAHRFWFASAEANFIFNGSGLGAKRLHMEWKPPSTLYGTFNGLVVTGTSCTPNAEDTTLNCSGMVPFTNYTEDINFNGPQGYLTLIVMQNSGSVQTVRNVKLTLVAL